MSGGIGVVEMFVAAICPDFLNRSHALIRAQSHATKLGPLARGCIVSPDANLTLRHCCATLRYTRIRNAPWLLTALAASQARASCNGSSQRVTVS